MKQLFRRHFQLSMLGLALMLGLSACLGLSSTPNTQATISINNPATNLSPTPTAPAYLVGAYVSNSTPTATSGTITVYVIFHHGQVPQPGGQVNLYFHSVFGGGIDALNNQAGTQTTGPDGFAIFSIGFGGLTSGEPIAIDVTVHFHGIPDITEPNAASFTPVTLTPTGTPSDSTPTGG